MDYHVVRCLKTVSKRKIGNVDVQLNISCQLALNYPRLALKPNEERLDEVELLKLPVLPPVQNVGQQLIVVLSINDQVIGDCLMATKIRQVLFARQNWIVALGNVSQTCWDDSNFIKMQLQPWNTSSFPPCPHLTQTSVYGHLNCIEIFLDVHGPDEVLDWLDFELEMEDYNILNDVANGLLANSMVLRRKYPLVFSKLVPEMLPNLTTFVPSIASSINNIIQRSRKSVDCLKEFSISDLSQEGRREPNNTTYDKLLNAFYHNALVKCTRVDQKTPIPRNVPPEYATTEIVRVSQESTNSDDLEWDREELEDELRSEMSDMLTNDSNIWECADSIASSEWQRVDLDEFMEID